MNEIVKNYLAQKEAEEAERRKTLLMEEGLYYKVYLQEGEYRGSEYSDWDAEKQQYYRKEPIAVSDEEFREIKKYIGRDGPGAGVGKKIMALATAVCWIGILASIFAGVLLMAQDEDMFIWGMLVAVGGSLVAWICSWFMYGYGQLIEDTRAIRRKMEEE